MNEATEQGGCKRIAERFSVTTLRSPAGSILDMSATGMRLVSPGRLRGVGRGDIHRYTIDAPGFEVTVRGKVSWVRRSRPIFGKQTIGVEFVEKCPNLRELLSHLAKHGYAPKKMRMAFGSAGVSGGGEPAVRASVHVEDLYSIFGLQRFASADQVREAYHRTAMRLHPDSPEHEHAVREVSVDFETLAKAYRILRDDRTRARYDEMLRAAS